MRSFVLACTLVAVTHLPSVAQTRVGEPAGILDVVVVNDGALWVPKVHRIVARIDPASIGADFAGVAGFALSVRPLGGARILTTGLPEGGSGDIEFSPTSDGTIDLRVEIATPLAIVNGVVTLAEVQTWPPDDDWVGAAIEVRPSFASELGGWPTWRESARAGACSDSDPDLRPCVRPFDRIERARGFSSDRLVTWVPDLVVAPGERFRLPVYGQCESQLLWARTFDMATIDVGLSWEASQLRLLGGVFARRAADFDSTASFRVARTFAPALRIANVTERVLLYSLEFEVPVDATGTLVRVDHARSTLTGGSPWEGGAKSGSVRVVDCEPFHVDGSGGVTSADAVVVLRNFLDRRNGARELCAGDVDRDGRLLPHDAVLVLRRVVGLPRPVAGVGVAAVDLAADDGQVVLQVDAAAGLDVTLDIGEATFRGVSLVEGSGLIAARASESELRIAGASATTTDRTIAITLDDARTVRLVDIAATDASGTPRETVLDRTEVSFARVRSTFLGAFPNPFNASTSLRFTVDRPQSVRFHVVDSAGRRVRTLVHETVAGQGAVTWDGRDDTGRAVASGVYHVVMRSAEGTSTGRVVLVE